MAAIAAERDLLFGLLALQNGLIDQGQLVAAFQAWTRDKARALADHLVGRGDLEADDRSAVEALVARHLKKHGGDVERSLAAMPAGRSTRESLAAIGDPTIEHTLTQLAPGPDSDADRTANYAVGTASADGQRFRVLRPHARGGLGAVFVALDAELNREVALKQILDQHADDPASRARFLLEAEITGGLEHPGIVPIYGLGAHADSRPFYVMRFIKGDSLKEAIDRFHADESLKSDPGGRSLALRKLLRRFIDVCNAIDYAHSRGVLHRDIKPGNIIVGRHGETLVVDWGLAKATGQSDPGAGERTLMPSSASGSAETLPGSALGTPSYMSPEQAAGELDRLGPRSDVYSLGATLYCLLTGKPPLEGEDIGGLLRRAQQGDFPRPRQRDPSIDMALEAVCLKAMALRPEDRYGSPRLLAEEIERWMADEPVTAWAEPWTRTLLRWLTRHRVGITGVAAAGLAALVGLVAVALVQTQARAALAAKNSALAQANDRVTAANADLKAANESVTAANDALAAANSKVEARYNLALDAIKTFHTGVSEDFLLKEEKFKALRDRLLESASDFYGKLSALLGKETDVAARRALARSNFELAELTRKVGRLEDGLAAHRAVLAARDALAREPGADAAVRIEQGRSLMAVAAVLSSTVRTEEALTTYRRAESVLASLASSDPDARAALANCRTAMARLLLLRGKNDEAFAECMMARADQQALAAVAADSRDNRRDRAATAHELSFILLLIRKLPEAEAEILDALEIQRKLVRENPTDAEFRASLASYQSQLAGVLEVAGKTAAAEEESRGVLQILDRLAEENPAVTTFRRRKALGHKDLGNLLLMTGRPAAAVAEIRLGLAIFQGLADENPAMTAFQDDLGLSHSILALALYQAGHPAEGVAEAREAVAIQQKQVDENPTDRVRRDVLAFHLETLGDAARSGGQTGEARSAYERAMALLERRVQEEPTNSRHRFALSDATWRRGLTLRDLGDTAGAVADIRRALRLCEGLTATHGLDWYNTACNHSALAGMAGRAGSGVSASEADRAADTAMELLTRSVAVGIRNLDEFRIESALDPLRSRDDYKLLMMDAAFPLDPFATAP